MYTLILKKDLNRLQSSVQDGTIKLTPYSAYEAILRDFFDGFKYICDQIDCSSKLKDYIIMSCKKDNIDIFIYICNKFNVTPNFYSSWSSIIFEAKKAGSMNIILYFASHGFIRYEREFEQILGLIDYNFTTIQTLQVLKVHGLKEYIRNADFRHYSDYSTLKKIQKCLTASNDIIVDDVALNCLLPYI